MIVQSASARQAETRATKKGARAPRSVSARTPPIACGLLPTVFYPGWVCEGDVWNVGMVEHGLRIRNVCFEPLSPMQPAHSEDGWQLQGGRAAQTEKRCWSKGGGEGSRFKMNRRTDDERMAGSLTV